jgi:hypothetical protein
MRQIACGSRKQRPLWNRRIYCELPGLGSQSQSRRNGALFPKRPTKVFTRRSVGDVFRYANTTPLAPEHRRGGLAVRSVKPTEVGCGFPAG